MDVRASLAFNAALFGEMVRKQNLSNMLTDPAPKQLNTKKLAGKSLPGAPIVRITDLQKNAGDEVEVDLVHMLNGQPAMGDELIAGYMESLTFASDRLKINQGRKGVRPGGRMAQKRTAHGLLTIAKGQMMPWYSRFDDQTTLVHMAGARGDDTAKDWIVPLQSNSRFSKMLVNPVLPPTYDRHWYGGNATAIDNIDSADTMSLTAIDNIRLRLDEMAFPLQALKYNIDTAAEDDPLHLALLTPRQMRDFLNSTGGQTLQTMMAHATKRSSMFKHPLFASETYLWKNILIKKAPKGIFFNAGSSVAVSTNTATAGTTTATPGVRVERALILGAQALAIAFGKTETKNGLFVGLHQETTDHGAQKELSIAWMNGKKKIRFLGSDGRVNDLGIAVLDTAVASL